MKDFFFRSRTSVFLLLGILIFTFQVSSGEEKDFDFWWKDARKALKNRYYARAAHSYKQAWKLRSHRIDCAIHSANLYLKLGQPLKAFYLIRSIKKVPKKHKKEIGKLRRKLRKPIHQIFLKLRAKGIEHRINENFPQSIRSFDGAIDLKPQDYHTHFEKALTCARWGKEKKAMLSLEKALQMGFFDHQRLLAEEDFDDIRKKKKFLQLIGNIFGPQSLQKHLEINKKGRIPGFRFLGVKTYRCGGITKEVRVYQHKTTKLKFSYIPSGVYFISGDGRKAKVRLKAFLISQKEITQEIWTFAMGTKPWEKYKTIKRGSDYPAVYISWNQARKFCDLMGLRLPSEVEWEVACRGGAKTKYYWGNEVKKQYLWYAGETYDKKENYPHRVSQKKANAFGLYDMSGNVWEWCEDGYHSRYPYYKNNTPAPAQSVLHRVYRGGSWESSFSRCQSGFRYYNSPDYQGAGVGFRVAYSVKKIYGKK